MGENPLFVWFTQSWKISADDVAADNQYMLIWSDLIWLTDKKSNHK